MKNRYAVIPVYIRDLITDEIKYKMIFGVIITGNFYNLTVITDHHNVIQTITAPEHIRHLPHFDNDIRSCFSRFRNLMIKSGTGFPDHYYSQIGLERAFSSTLLVPA